MEIATVGFFDIPAGQNHQWKDFHRIAGFIADNQTAMPCYA